MKYERGDVAVVTMRSGLVGLLDREVGEVMHPVVGALAESARYVESCRLTSRLAEPTNEPLTVFDVGMGAASNAAAVWRAALAHGALSRGVHLVSFERSLAALRLASQHEHACHFGLTDVVAQAIGDLLDRGAHQSGPHRWSLIGGELPASLQEASTKADIVLWDPFSPQANPELWNVHAFRLMRERCAPGATLHTFSGATAVRSALLLAGFYVGFGDATNDKGQYTAAAVDLRDLERPLDERWLHRLLRSSTPLPSDAVNGALEQIKTHPQFAPR
jgi:queuine tRNA-ribosyltransferase